MNRYFSDTQPMLFIKTSLSLRLHLYKLSLLHKLTRWPIMQKVRCHKQTCSNWYMHAVSVLFQLYIRFFSPFPHGTTPLSVKYQYLG